MHSASAIRVKSVQSSPGKKSRKETVIAIFALAAIGFSLLLQFGVTIGGDILGLPYYQVPLLLALFLGGIPLVFDLLLKVIHAEFGSDLLAGISIVTSVLLGEYLAGSLVVLMLSGGEALETYAVRSASRALDALARRMPSIAHRRKNGKLVDVELTTVRLSDELEVFPHEI